MRPLRLYVEAQSDGGSVDIVWREQREDVALSTTSLRFQPTPETKGSHFHLRVCMGPDRVRILVDNPNNEVRKDLWRRGKEVTVIMRERLRMSFK
jgi:hypothetical protein